MLVIILKQSGGEPCCKFQQVKNVTGCRDTRTAKSKETRGMIEHNSEVSSSA